MQREQYVQRLWGVKEPDLYWRKRKEARKLGAGWGAECGMQPGLGGGECGFYSRCHRKPFESFEQGSDMI